MLSKIANIFRPAPHIPRLPDDAVRYRYPKFRWQILEATFLGYATFYLVRNNLSPVAKEIEAAVGYDHAHTGTIIAATAASYGIGKFFMGALSDRSNPRVFMSLGLFLTALCNFAFGASHDYSTHLWLWALNGLVQGMGWPPCGRSMGHWFSENERGLTFSTWNTSHNLGGGIAGYLAAWATATFGGWEYAFYVPGVIALAGALYLALRLRDTPQSVGLPPIEEYRNDYTAAQQESNAPERELSYKELLIDNVLAHKWIWLLAIANFFAYITRYAMLDWGPTYVREVKGASLTTGGATALFLEFGGIPSTILLGWISDKYGGRRGMIATLAMIPIIAAFIVMLLTPGGLLWLDYLMLAVIGFCIYPVINLITIIALDLTSKKAIGVAAGFIGLFGYAGRTVMNLKFGPILDQYKKSGNPDQGWQIVLGLIIGSGIIATLLLAMTWRIRPRKAA